MNHSFVVKILDFYGIMPYIYLYLPIGLLGKPCPIRRNKMAKDDKAKVKFTVFHFETESDSATLQENIKSIANTISRAFSTPKVIYVNNPQGQLTTGNGAAAEVAIEDVLENDALDVDVEPAPAKPVKKPRTVKIKTPDVLENVEFTSGPMPLKQFMEEKKVGSEQGKRYLLIAYWFKEYGNTPTINAAHIFTAYKFMGWSAPKDVAQPLRDIKAKNKWFSGEKGEYTINHIGENVVNEMN
jgi:hypothetical protein